MNKIVFLIIFALVVLGIMECSRFLKTTSRSTNPIGHLGFYVEDLKKSDNFYRPLLQVIGMEVIFELPACIACGFRGRPYFEIYTGKPKTSPFHIVFEVPQKELVHAFYEQALKLGAQDNGAPGYRKYFPGYYAAFVIDPDGHNLEALFWDAEAPS